MFVQAPRSAHSARDWLRWPLVVLAVPLLAATVGFSAYLWPEWNRNPDLSHGFFAPLVFALLVWEGSRMGTQRWLAASLRNSVLVAGLLGAALASCALGGLLAASLGWQHAAVTFCFALALIATLGAGWIALADDRLRAVPLNWTVFTGIMLWLLVAPLPTGTYTRLMLALQTWVTTGVLNALHLLGIPARQSGNIIELATTSVGVEDACSGIRSLISCSYAGLFFAAWLLRSPGKRAALILIAPVLAIAMNFARSLTLTLLANRGVDINGFWHDVTGYAILGLTAALLAVLATLLGSGTPEVAPTAPASATPVTPRPAWAFTLGATALAGLLAFFFVASRPGSAPVATAPEVPLAKLIPADAANWQVKTLDDLTRFSGILQTNHLLERNYRGVIDGQPVQLNVYIAHWVAGAAPVSLVASHTPDACWPGAGWKTESHPDRQVDLTLGAQRLPTAEHRIFRYGQAPQHVWFWHIYNGRVINYRDPYSVPALVEIALRYGFSREGSQYFIRVSSNVPWEKLRDQPVVRELFANLAPIGLQP